MAIFKSGNFRMEIRPIHKISDVITFSIGFRYEDKPMLCIDESYVDLLIFQKDDDSLIKFLEKVVSLNVSEKNEWVSIDNRIIIKGTHIKRIIKPIT